MVPSTSTSFTNSSCIEVCWASSVAGKARANGNARGKIPRDVGSREESNLRTSFAGCTPQDTILFTRCFQLCAGGQGLCIRRRHVGNKQLCWPVAVFAEYLRIPFRLPFQILPGSTESYQRPVRASAARSPGCCDRCAGTGTYVGAWNGEYLVLLAEGTRDGSKEASLADSHVVVAPQARGSKELKRGLGMAVRTEVRPLRAGGYVFVNCRVVNCRSRPLQKGGGAGLFSTGCGLRLQLYIPSSSFVLVDR